MKKLFSIKYTLIVTSVILIGLFMPGDNIPSVGVPGLDKVVHFGMFFVLTGTYGLEYWWHYKRLPHKFKTLSSILAFAIFTEIIQALSGTRSGDLKDLLADSIGMISGYLILSKGLSLYDKKELEK